MAGELLWMAGIGVALLVCHGLLGTKGVLAAGLGNVALGIGALLAVNFLGQWLGIGLPLSPLHLGLSAAGGPAGVAVALLLQWWLV